MNSLKITATEENYQRCAEFIEDKLRSKGFDTKTTLRVLGACEEIIVNIINYAYKDGQGELEIRFDDTKDKISITFSDEGSPFNPLELPDAKTNLPLDEMEAGGLGILMVRKLMDEVSYDYLSGRNILTIVKYV